MATENLHIKITAIDKTRRAFNAIKGRVAGFAKVVGVAAAASVALFAKIGQEIDKLAKTSSRLDITVEQLRSLQFAAGLAGASTEDVRKGMTRLARSISEASTGIGTAKDTFERLGVSITDNNGRLRDNQEIFNDVADAISKLKNPADRVRAAYDIFGRSGEKLVNLLVQGSGAIADTRKEFEDLSVHLSDEQAQAVEAANDQFSMLGVFFVSLAHKATSVVLPALAKLATFLVKLFLRAINNVIEAGRILTNTFIGLVNKVKEIARLGDEPIKPVTFGTETQEEIDELIAALEKYNKVRDGARKQPPLDVTIGVGEAVAQLSDKMEVATVATEKTRTALEQYGDAARDTFSQLQDIGVASMQNLEDALLGVVNGTMSAKDAFRSMALSIVNDLIRMQIRQSITGPLSGLLGSAMGGLFGGAGGGTASGSLLYSPPGRAVGGSVSRNTPYMVGEKGPELFVPGASGTIVRNENLQAQGGGQTTIVNQTIQIETGVSQTVRSEIMSLLPQIKEQTKAAVLDSRRRGGQFASAFR